MKNVQIIKTRYYYGGVKRYRLLDNETGQVWTGSRKEALALIRRLEGEVYHLANGESGRPSYTITYNNRQRDPMTSPQKGDVWEVRSIPLGGGEWGIEVYDDKGYNFKSFVGNNGTQGYPADDLWADYDKWYDSLPD